MLLCVYMSQLFIWIITSFFKDCSKGMKRFHAKYDMILFWGSIMRLIFEGYIEMSLSVLLSLTDLSWDDANYAIINDNVYMIICCTIILTLPFYFFFYYRCRIKSMQDKEFMRRYGDIFEGLALSKSKDKRISAIFYPFWFVTRRLIFAMVVVCFDKVLWL